MTRTFRLCDSDFLKKMTFGTSIIIIFSEFLELN
jgi:hypothetical protein